ncbi:baseplate J/gp47 family protein [Sphingomonas sp. CBMAI 2297]|uniref:baseplate J/gp47 family protein n=1 Tax=Sphingomonas sp. CBMAI 2297 TaxID=2991720 RepID=UPI002453D1EC|nr:baseplate J/gp47 family protein [Sphingomonas sp. CBMAI 2297]MDH4745815.1 baseplate J/gp47 family protein [Sphingomonas sp. CBMAI 2297]
MAFPRPTRDQLKAQAEADVISSLPATEALLRFSNLRTMAVTQAGLANGQYGYLDYMAKQGVPFTAEEEALEGWSAFKGVTRKPATRAAGIVRFNGTNGAVVPEGTPVLRSDGFAFAASQDTTVVGGVAAVPVTASTPGSAGNSGAGTGFAIVAGVSGVASGGIAIGPLTGGANVELDDSLRARMMFAFANPPQGGSKSDYERWAREVPGVTRAWAVPNGMGPSTVVVYFMMDDAQAVHGGYPQGGNGVAAGERRDTPATGDQLTVANALFVKQPATPLVYAVAPRANTINMTIAGLGTASDSLKAAIVIAIKNALFLGGIPGGKTNVSAIEAAIAAVNGSAGFVIIGITAGAGTVNPGAAGNIISNAGFLPALGAVTWAA